MQSYLWRAEYQKNGNIHFHILTDLQIPFFVAEELWNRTLSKLDYINRFAKKFGHENPPSTRTEIIVNKRKLNSYISKYLSKEEDKCFMTGRHWSCSQNLSKLDNQELILTGEQILILENLVASKQCAKFETDYSEFYLIDIDMIAELIDPVLELQVNEIYDNIRGMIYHPPLPDLA